MQNYPLVTIICLCYNHEKFIVEALESVKNQEYPAIQLLIADDCSTDNSKEVIKKWLVQNPDVTFVSNKKNIGNTKTFNKMVTMAKGEYLIDLAADDILLPNSVQLQVKCFQESSYPNLAIVYGNSEIITENGKHYSYCFPVNNDLKVTQKQASGNIYSKILAGGNVLCSISAMMKKDIFDKNSGYDENLYYEDLDYWIRIARNYNFDFIDAILVQKRQTTNSLGNQFYLQNPLSTKINKSAYTILKKAFALNKTTEEHKALLKRVHFQIILNFKNKNISLLYKLLLLKIKIFFKTHFQQIYFG